MNTNDLPKFALNIKRIRKERNLSQQNLADLSNVSRQSIGAYEKGIRRPKIDSTLRMAAALNVAPQDLDPFSIYEHPDDTRLECLAEEAPIYMTKHKTLTINLEQMTPTIKEKLLLLCVENDMTPTQFINKLIEEQTTR